jgi:hypothetical protein
MKTIRVLVPNPSLAEPPFKSTIERIKKLTNLDARAVGSSYTNPVVMELQGDDTTLETLIANKLNAFYPASITIEVDVRDLTISPTSATAAALKQLLGFELNIHDTKVEPAGKRAMLRIIGNPEWVERLVKVGIPAAAGQV